MPPGGAAAADDPIARHRLNNAMLAESDVIVPAYPGSGHALLGNVLLELGLNYADPYTETFGPAAGSTPLPEQHAYRQRLAATAKGGLARNRGAMRFVKTHLYPVDFPLTRAPILLLVRDPRDAIHSYYRWRLGFSEEGETGSFEDFLRRPGPNRLVPWLDWTRFQEAWLARRANAVGLFVVRFEDLKRSGAETLAPILRALAPAADLAAIDHAFAASSFEAMRVHEDRVAGDGAERIMRRGKVEEWREWFAGPIASLFQDLELHETASRLGYADWPVEVGP